ncbi:MAG: GntP family permease [Niabella sp.]
MSLFSLALLVLAAIILIIFLTSVIKLNAFISLFVVSLLLAVLALPDKDIIGILKEGFGNTMGSIGFLIIFGTIIAVVLEISGGAISIANYILLKTGENNAAAALAFTGYITGIPIFCDSGFIILSGLAKTFSSKTKIAVSFLSIALATSLYAVHCLIPTHPGSLAASGIINVNLGKLILWGLLFAVPAAMVAYYWTKWRTRNDKIVAPTTHSEVTFPSTQYPSVFLSLLPIIVPLLLITFGSLIKVIQPEQNFFSNLASFTGQPIVALFAGVILSVFLLKQKTVKAINEVLGTAIEKAGPIIIITAAGGMFGLVIKETGVGQYLGEKLVNTGLGLTVPFLIAFVLKTAQGSSTVAIITAASLIVPMLPLLGLDSENGKLLTMISLSAGSMMVSHPNDSYFWVVNRFSGISISTSLKVYTPATVIMGITVFVCALLVSWFVL